MGKKFLLSVVIILFVVFSRTSAVNTKDLHPLVIDTDCAFDDMRAISIILSQPDIRVTGIVVTEGTLLPEEGTDRIRALLHIYSLDTIPVVCGKTYNREGPPWRNLNRSVSWGTAPTVHEPAPDAVHWLQTILVSAGEKITYVCLGPLSTLESAIGGKPELQARLYRILWYNEPVGSAAGFNYTFDKPSADSVMKMKIRMDLISNPGDLTAFPDSSVHDLSGNSSTPLAAILLKTVSQPAVTENQNQHHPGMADELVSVYFTNPELFDMMVLHPQVHIRYNREVDLQSVKEVFSDMIKGSYKRSDNVVFSEFPSQRVMFAYDVRKIMDSVISRYGPEEWKACVITDEFHGHLGVFSIVGAKMGIKAREYFGAGPDVLTVISYAGTKPPYSCLNDGIQVSTGATIGQGLITVVTQPQTRPEAVFTYHERSLRLKLKEEYLALIEHDIEEGILKFGLTDDGYWKMIRRSALSYWLNWDRDVIFEVIVTNTERPK